MKWKPIDSAPKDGTHVLVSRAALTSKSNEPIRPPAVAYWSGTRQGNYRSKLVEGWCGVDSGSTVLGRPTHWMPLPPDPEGV